MREIKFRVFVKGVKKMLYFDNPGLVMCNFDEGPGYGMGLRLVGGHAYLGKYSDLMQYTGEHDCTGKEIYDGDIVRTSDNDDELAVVEWDDEDLRFTVTHGNVVNGLGEEYYPREVEVVGNIYENPELIGGADDEH